MADADGALDRLAGGDSDVDEECCDDQPAAQGALDRMASGGEGSRDLPTESHRSRNLQRARLFKQVRRQVIAEQRQVVEDEVEEASFSVRRGDGRLPVQIVHEVAWHGDRDALGRNGDAGASFHRVRGITLFRYQDCDMCIWQTEPSLESIRQ